MWRPWSFSYPTCSLSLTCGMHSSALNIRWRDSKRRKKMRKMSESKRSCIFQNIWILNQTTDSFNTITILLIFKNVNQLSSCPPMKNVKCLKVPLFFFPIRYKLATLGATPPQEGFCSFRPSSKWPWHHAIPIWNASRSRCPLIYNNIHSFFISNSKENVSS